MSALSFMNLMVSLSAIAETGYVSGVYDWHNAAIAFDSMMFGRRKLLGGLVEFSSEYACGGAEKASFRVGRTLLGDEGADIMDEQ